MAGNKFKAVMRVPKTLFKTADSRFIISVGFKVSLISFGVTLFIYTCLLQVMRLNYAFLKSQGLPDLIGWDLFFQYILGQVLDGLPLLFSFHILLFFFGTYLGWLILRPFRQIGDYAERALLDPNTVYKIDEFSAHRLLTRFSEFFFEYLRGIRKKGSVAPNSIPPQYSKIHKPVTDKVFMFHFTMLLVIISLFTSVFIFANTTTMYGSLVELATKILVDKRVLTKYFSGQNFIIEDIITVTVVFMTAAYTMLGFHLYSKVSGAAFGIFSTMRSFMKGNYSSRVHLLGYSYLRDYTRKLNKYLDFIQNNFSKEEGND